LKTYKHKRARKNEPYPKTSVRTRKKRHKNHFGTGACRTKFDEKAVRNVVERE